MFAGLRQKNNFLNSGYGKGIAPDSGAGKGHSKNCCDNVLRTVRVSLLTFGLSNAAVSFQRFIHHVLRGMIFRVPYFDNMLVTSKDEDQHLSHLKQVFQRFREHGVVLNASKSVLGETSVKFLGHVVTAEGISSLPEKVAVIMSFPRTETVKELRRFLAICIFIDI
ncbi:retrovirus-related Pol polyprotein from transposon 297 [Trichonephila clavata]|uniref:Retrovirus-related Pol polyprotein from transposon 297 n=1 Tax=Trichonephila clavata TaxID=2740835 RepID=A0A8X6I212_TRICU|nr:retrovirus-related Pol polyprotein from transposon 297 [Trichonephila clavata]